MYKVLLPLAGYGYCIGDETEHISEEDAKLFLAHNMISIIETPEPKKEKAPATKSVK